MPKLFPLPSYRTSPRWTETDARAALAALAASRLSTKEFATREGLDAQRIYCWRRKLERASTPTAVAPKLKMASTPDAVAPTFVELRAATPERVEIVLPSGLVLRVSESIDAADLRRLVEALEPSRSC